MVHANIVETNITTLILILPNGLGLVILYTMKYEIQSVYRAVVLRKSRRLSQFKDRIDNMVPFLLDPVYLSKNLDNRHSLLQDD